MTHDFLPILLLQKNQLCQPIMVRAECALFPFFYIKWTKNIGKI